MRKLGYVVAAAGALVLATPSQAAAPPVTITFANHVTAMPAYLSSLPLRGFGTGAPSTSPGTVYAPASDEAISGDVRLYSGDVSGEAIGPEGASGNFLAVLNGSYTINFGSAPARVVSFLLGGLDIYNTVTFNYVGGGSTTLTGREIIGGTTAGEGTNTGETGRVTYDFGSTAFLSSIVFGSSQRTFEIDSVVAAAPEPATWAMMIFGFGMVGGTLRRRRREGKRAFA